MPSPSAQVTSLSVSFAKDCVRHNGAPSKNGANHPRKFVEELVSPRTTGTGAEDRDQHHGCWTMPGLQASWNMAQQSGEVGIAPRRRSAHCHRGNSQMVKDLVVTPWELMPKETKLMEPRFPLRYNTLGWCRNTVPYLGCKSCHALPGLGFVQIED